jgi:hypothetical protein
MYTDGVGGVQTAKNGRYALVSEGLFSNLTHVNSVPIQVTTMSLLIR